MSAKKVRPKKVRYFPERSRGLPVGRFFCKAILIFTLLFLAVTLAACTNRQVSLKKDNSLRDGGVLNYFIGEPVAIDPAFAQEQEGIQVIKQLFDGLIDYDPKTLAIKPAVAKRWSSNAAGDTWTFWLRKGVKFHNGREVTAADFIYAWSRVARKKTASEAAYHLAPIKGFKAVQKGRASRLSGVTAPKKYVLKVRLNYPFAGFPMVLGHPVFSPVPKEEIKKQGRGFAEQPVGNGPFAMDGPWNHEKNIKLKNFDDYYGTQANLEGADLKIIDNQQTAFLEFKGGGLDYSTIPNGQIKPTIKQYGSDAIVGRPQLALKFYGFNLRRGPFKNNPELRQAINYAINRGSIVTNVYENVYLAAGGIVPPVVDKYKRPASVYSYSPAKAKQLLKESGYPGGKGLPQIKLIYNTGRGNEEPAQVVQENLRDIGIKVKLEGLEFGAFLNALRAGKMSMFAATWQADYPSRDAFLYSLFYSKSNDNMLGFANRQVDSLLSRARKSLKPGQRRELYEKAEVEILKQAPVVPIAYVGTSVVHAPRVKGFIRTGLDDTPLDRVWLSKE